MDTPNTNPTNPVPSQPQESTPPQPVAAEHRPIVHTYEADLALAMDTTDAPVVQELLKTAQAREVAEKEKNVVQHQRGWYTTAGIILIILALGAATYGVYYFRHLTVLVTPTASVGVFQTTDPIVASTETIQQGIARLTTDPTTIPEGKPVLVPIVSDATTLTPLATGEALSFMGITASEPFIASLSVARLGLMNTGTTISPFLIFSAPNPEVASKEFLIAEPDLLDMVGPVLHIDLTNPATVVDTDFTSTYMYNLPVRTLKSSDLDTKEETILLYYGYATDNTIVVATNPSILKAVYDTIIQQR